MHPLFSFPLFANTVRLIGIRPMPDKARRVEKARLNRVPALIMCLAVWQTGNQQVFHIVLRGADRRITFGENEDCFRFMDIKR